MNNQAVIRKIEELSMNALPSLQTQLFDGWILRFSNNYAKRANSINPLYFSSEDVEKKIEKCVQIYRNNNLKVVYKLTDHIFPNELDNILEKKGYDFDGLTSVQLLSLNNLEISQSSSTVIYNNLADKWFTAFCELNKIHKNNQPTLKMMLENIVSDVCYVVLFNHKNETLACGMGVLEDEYIGLFDIVTNQKHRKKGYGMQLVLTILHWGKENGAKNAYLQVVLNNSPALRLYSKIGFKEEYRYWYRIQS